jgi:hypothetical protein
MAIDGRVHKVMAFGAQSPDKETRVLIGAEFQSVNDGGSVDGHTSFSFTTNSAMSRYLAGSVAEIRIWNTVMSPDKIQMLHSQRVTGMAVCF